MSSAFTPSPSAAQIAPGAFLLRPDELRALGGVKWNRYPAEVLPAWVADMDFLTAAPIRAAAARVAERGGFVYPLREGKDIGLVLAEAFAERMEGLYDWSPAPENTMAMTGLVQAVFALVTGLTDPGDGIIVHVPTYPPFRAAAETTGRRFVAVEGSNENGRYRWDLASVAPEALRGCAMMVLCNPQNPTGRVFTREELEAVAEFALAHDLIVIADEVHAELLHPGQRHIPFATLGPEVAARTITLQSASKSFSVAGLCCAVMHFGSAALKQRLAARLPERALGHPSAIAVDATLAAWRQGGPWLDAVRGQLTAMRDRLAARLPEAVPGARMNVPEGTYLAWIDMSAVDLQGAKSAYQFFLDRAKVAFSAGETFRPGAERFVRFNFATSAPILDDILARMAEAVRG
jgi:cystathionine beta-lyase